MQLIFWLVANIFFFIFPYSDQLRLVEVVYSSTRTYRSANPSFDLVKASFLSTGNSIVLFWGFFG